MTAPVRVFIVDDHPVVRAGLRELLRSSRDITIVGDAEDASETTLAALRTTECQVAIVDIRLKTGDGIDLCQRIKACDASVGVVLLSAFWDETLVRRALDAGADGYLLKDAEHLDLHKAIASVARGESFFDTAVSAAIAREARGAGTAAARELSQQDVRILRFVGEGLTNKAIARVLFLSPHTVRDRVSAAMAILGAKNRTEAAQIATKRSLI